MSYPFLYEWIMSIKSKNEVTTKVLDPSVLIDFDSMFASWICEILTIVLKVDYDCLAIYIITTFKYFKLIC